MKVLVLETEPGAADDAIARLDAAGHDVVRCHDARQPAFPCAALAENGRCPLDGGAIDVALTVRAHPRPTPAPLEDGVACALRARVPLVVAGRTALAPHGPWAAERVDGDWDVVGACERAARAPLRRHTQLAWDALEALLTRWGYDTGRAEATVRRSGGALVVLLTVPEDVPRGDVELAVTRVVAALRAHDPAAVGVDVAVQRTAAEVADGTRIETQSYFG